MWDLHISVNKLIMDFVGWIFKKIIYTAKEFRASYRPSFNSHNNLVRQTVLMAPGLGESLLALLGKAYTGLWRKGISGSYVCD